MWRTKRRSREDGELCGANGDSSGEGLGKGGGDELSGDNAENEWPGMAVDRRKVGLGR